ncbi:hypothetical protein MYX84_04080 [Acidobacteria bacterium AH-259-O06]|nr:hypothetical protein [Acidobacteria bacterium AH-259-O06]
MAEEDAVIREKVFQAYREATTLFKQADYEEALAKYDEVIALGRDWPHDDMVSRSVHAALDQVTKCQYRLLKI